MAKVLMAAYACEPAQGSEPAVGWNWALEAARAGHDVCVVTRSNNREAIEQALGTVDGPIPRYEYIDLPLPFRRLKQWSGHAGLLAYYYLWQVRLAFVAWRLHRANRFEVAHHVTFVNDTMPSGLSVVPIPFVWGPVGGSTHRLPASISLDLPPHARRHERVRRALQLFLGRVDPFVALTRRRASVILVYTREALDGLRERERDRARPVVHIGVTETEPPHRSGSMRVDEANARLTVLTGGRLVHWKGIDLLIEGIARVVRSRPEADVRLIVTGSGQYRDALARLAEREGIADRVRFVGRLATRTAVFELMDECDLFALPTLRDGPPVAILEAMAFGLPVLCLDLGATAELVPDGAGFKVAPRDRASVVSQIADACAWTLDHPTEAIEMGGRGRSHALIRHRWDQIRDVVDEAYAEAIGRSQRPETRRLDFRRRWMSSRHSSS
jgi:glycosyltransferase involved in cell wall biosynthesis